MQDEKQMPEGCSEEKCASCASAGTCPSKNGPESFLEAANEFSNIKKVIGIVSGKGGVGKSFVTGSIAVELAKKGYKVGILDADITGPSIQKMFGITGQVDASEMGIFPKESTNGIKIMSINMLLDNDETPVIWRGPVLAGVVKQFWSDVVWGDLDFLLVDMPPGTGDVPLTVFQSIPLNGIVIVTSPQSLVKMIVKKAANMAGQMNIPVLGIIENYSYIVCPDCGKKIDVFGKSSIDEVAKEMNLDILGKMPINTEDALKADAGDFDNVVNENINKALEKLIEI